jgi:lauroyl/myristoyl acyltransferase
MQDALGIPAAVADALARRALRAVEARAHFELRLAAGRATLFPEGSTMTGLEHFDRALGTGKGVILVTIHRFAALQGLLALRERGYPILAVRARQGGRSFGRIVRRLAARARAVTPLWPDRLTPDDPDLPLKILTQLRAGGPLYLTADVQHTKHAVPVKFMNGVLRVNPGVFEFARLTGCQLVPIDIRYDLDASGGDTRLRIDFEAPLICRSSGNKDERDRDNLSTLAATLERMVRRCPEQWKRWIGK